MAGSALLSTLATVLLLLVVVVTISIAGQRREMDVSGASFDVLDRLSGPVGWMLGFVLVAMLLGGGAIVAVADGGFVPGVGSSGMTTLVLLVLSLMLGAYVLLGTYYAVRYRGAASSLAAAISASLLGFVVLAVITLQLVGLI